ncbi:TolC family protein, partial [Salmonella sp. SAL4435]|uniref:TolC family protein n=1 Tax=Salmonella sp. SAL4435 TaxID=3159890 RepID=UPI003979BE0D
VSWEADVWGRLRRNKEAAYADFVATVEAQSGVIVTLLGDVASRWFELLSIDAQLEVSQRQLANRQKTLELFKARLQG